MYILMRRWMNMETFYHNRCYCFWGRILQKPTYTRKEDDEAGDDEDEEVKKDNEDEETFLDV